MLKKQCQLAAKEEHAHRRLATERLVASSLHSAKAALEKVRGSRATRAKSRRRRARADTREADLKRRIALTGDAATRDAGRMRTREGAPSRSLSGARASSAARRAGGPERRRVDAQRRRGEAEAEIARAEAALAEARAEAQARGDTEGVLADRRRAPPPPPRASGGWLSARAAPATRFASPTASRRGRWRRLASPRSTAAAPSSSRASAACSASPST